MPIAVIVGLRSQVISSQAIGALSISKTSSDLNSKSCSLSVQGLPSELPPRCDGLACFDETPESLIDSSRRALAEHLLALSPAFNFADQPSTDFEHDVPTSLSDHFRDSLDVGADGNRGNVATAAR